MKRPSAPATAVPAGPTSPDTASATALQRRCDELGIATRYDDFWGRPHAVPEPALQRFLDAMGAPLAGTAAGPLPPVHVVRQAAPAPLRVNGAASLWQLHAEDGSTREGRFTVSAPAAGAAQLTLPADLPLGYHRLRLPELDAETVLIVCPERCHVPPALAAGARWWGLTVQVYALQSARNWGIGDFTDLRDAVQLAAAEGAAFVGVNPLHALFPQAPERASPYSPSSRVALNPLYLDLEAIPEFRAGQDAWRSVQTPAFQAELQRLRASPHIDFTAVAAAKQGVLRALHAEFRARELARDTPRARRFRAFQQQHREWLAPHALFEALQQAGTQPLPPSGSAQAHAFAQAHADDLEAIEYAQWQCDEQLGAVQAQALALGLPLGLYRDLAVGVSDGGAETWRRPGLHAVGISAGAPPEAYNPGGQSWGLPPALPHQLTALAYAPFIELLRANMQHAGALRIDHAMALQRLFWVPADSDARDGTYVAYPFDDLLNVLVLESVRARCLVIGEDLGNVPEGFRETLAERGVWSYGPMYFSPPDADGALPAPAAWPVATLAVVGTHDLPSLRAWWRGDDIALRTSLGLYPEPARRAEQVVSRAQDRARLLLALSREQLVPAGAELRPAEVDDADPALTDAVHAYLGRSSAGLVGVQFEDVVQQLDPVNVPGTDESQRPNWRVRVARPLHEIAADPRWRSVTAALREARGRAGPAALAGGLPALDTACIPRATYRIQFHAGMTFDDATRIVPYLDALGISHLYASPYLKARAGSTHGYDVVDHNALNPEVGTPASFDRLCQALRHHGMSQLLDIVPNHMGVLEADNAWWLDVLECGPASRHARTFDIEWHAAAPELDGRLLLPVLGDHGGRVLEAGELSVVFDADQGSFHAAYYSHRFPLDPRTYAVVLGRTPPPADAPADELAALQSLVTAFGTLPARDTADAAERAVRRRDKRVYQQRLAELAARHPWVRTWADAAAAAFSGTPGQPRSFDALDALLDQQAYRLAFWRVAGDDVNYRRFFDIDTLAAVRMEEPAVFDETHRTVMRWVAEERITGLRVDHPDGLADPRGYFERLQARHDAVRRDAGLAPRALYVSVEKILAEHEQIPADWPVHGGTGYRFSNQVNGLFVDSRHEAAFTRLHDQFTGDDTPFDDVLREAKHLVMSTSLASDLQWLTESLFRLAQRSRTTRDFTRNRLRAALMAVATGFPVYRTYIGAHGADATDRQHLDWAVADAKRHSAASDLGAIDFLRDAVLGQVGDATAFVTRWQQFTAPVMAKSMEDTAFYRHHRLVSLNDVGGDPRRFGTSVAAFHAANTTRARFLPHTLLGTSTHDSKRSEDVRARIDVLSEVPEAWQAAVTRWAALNRPRAERTGAVISPRDEYLLYQTLVGVWPLQTVDDASLASLRERVQAYLLKAVREAKLVTSWVNPDAAYERALSTFIDLLLATREPNPFLTDFEAWLAPVQRFGAWNSLNQVLFKLTSPGVPDVYQGCETWNFSLVDPDNRRPVPFPELRALLAGTLSGFSHGQLPDAAAHDMAVHLADGRLKMLLTARLLALRRTLPALFRDGGYTPLEAHGPAAEHVVAYARVRDTCAALIVGSRLPSGLTGHDPDRLDRARWEGTTVALPDAAQADWRDWLTGRPVPVAQAAPGTPRTLDLAHLPGPWPFAVLVPASVRDPLLS